MSFSCYPTPGENLLPNHVSNNVGKENAEFYQDDVSSRSITSILWEVFEAASGSFFGAELDPGKRMALAVSSIEPQK